MDIVRVFFPHSSLSRGHRFSLIFINTLNMYFVLVSFLLAAFCWQNHYYVMLLFSQGCRYISESSDIQSLFLWCGKSRIITSCKCYKLHEGYFSVQGRFCVDSNSKKSDPKKQSGRCVILSVHSSVSNIRPDDKNFPFGRPSVSRNFKLFNFASVRT